MELITKLEDPAPRPVAEPGTPGLPINLCQGCPLASDKKPDAAHEVKVSGGEEYTHLAVGSINLDHPEKQRSRYVVLHQNSTYETDVAKAFAGCQHPEKQPRRIGPDKLVCGALVRLLGDREHNKKHVLIQRF